MDFHLCIAKVPRLSIAKKQLMWTMQSKIQASTMHTPQPDSILGAMPKSFRCKVIWKVWGRVHGTTLVEVNRETNLKVTRMGHNHLRQRREVALELWITPLLVYIYQNLKKEEKYNEAQKNRRRLWHPLHLSKGLSTVIWQKLSRRLARVTIIPSRGRKARLIQLERAVRVLKVSSSTAYSRRHKHDREQLTLSINSLQV